MHQHLDEVCAMRLILRLPEYDLHGPDYAACCAVLGNQQRTIAGCDAFCNTAPKRLGFLA